jgi:hypothetical protein
MAKTLNTSGNQQFQANLRDYEYNRRRDEARDRAEGQRTSTELTALGMDPDVNDKSLAYFGEGAKAGGLVGALSSAFGAVRKMDAMDTKQEAVKGRKKANADLMYDQLKEIYGADKVDGILDQFGDDQRLDPTFLRNIGNNLQARDDKVKADIAYAQDQAIKATNSIKSAQEIETNNQSIESNNLSNQVLNYEVKGLERVDAERKQFEKDKPDIIKQLVKSGMPQNIAEDITQSPETYNYYKKHRFSKHFSKEDRGEVYDNIPEMKNLGISRELFINAPILPPQAFDIIMKRNIAHSNIGNHQRTLMDINNLREKGAGISGNAFKNAINELYPVGTTKRPSMEVMEYMVDKSGIVTSGNSENDYKEAVISLMGSSEIESEPALVEYYAEQYQNDAISNDEESDERIQNAMDRDPGRLAFNNNLMQLVGIAQEGREKFGYSAGGIPTINSPREVAGLDGGIVFQKGGNFYVTVSKPGEGPNPLSSNLFGGQKIKGRPYATDGFLSMNMGERGMTADESLTFDLLNKHDIPIFPHPKNNRKNAKNGGYRELSDSERRAITGGMSGLMNIPSPTNQESSSFRLKK